MKRESVLTQKEKKEKWDAFGMGVFLVVLGSGTLLAAWLLFQEATKRTLIEQFATATQQGNYHVLKEHTDWNSVRHWLKQDLRTRGTAHDSGVPSDPRRVDAIVDYYVRPENLPNLFYYYSTKANNVSPEAFVRDVRFSGFTEVTVEIAAPPQLDKPWINNLQPVRAVFQLEGLNWKLKRLDAPDYLIPTRAPSTYMVENAK